MDSPPDSFPRWDHHTSPGYPAAFPESWWAILARASVPRSSHGWVHSEPPPVGQSRYRSLQCRRRSRPPASGISYCRPPLDLLLSSDRFSSAAKRAASPQRQNQCHDASREALCSANWGGPLHKQNSYRHHDQGFYAGHGNTETTSPITLSDWNSGCLLRTAFLPRHPNPNGPRGSRGNRSGSKARLSEPAHFGGCGGAS